MKKKNILKRNSGFVVASILAAGASFFTVDTVLTELRPASSVPVESEREGTTTEAGTENTQATTYETNPFTITANGAVINQADNEALRQTQGETSATEANGQEETPMTDENGNVIEGSAQQGGGTAADGTDGSGLVEGSGTDGSSGTGTGSDGSSSGDDPGSGTGSNGSSTGDGSGSGTGSGGSSTGDGSGSSSGDGSGSSGGDSWSDGSSGGSGIEILDPGGGSWWDNSGSSGSSGSSSSGGSSSGGSSSGGSSSGGSYENGIYSPDDLILWHINSRYIGEEELYNYDSATLRLIRNEIFALHGRIFRSEDLQAYFGGKSWYVPTYDPDEFDANMGYYLNDYEMANLNVILAYEAALNG